MSEQGFWQRAKAANQRQWEREQDRKYRREERMRDKWGPHTEHPLHDRMDAALGWAVKLALYGFLAWLALFLALGVAQGLLGG